MGQIAKSLPNQALDLHRKYNSYLYIEFQIQMCNKVWNFTTEDLCQIYTYIKWKTFFIQNPLIWHFTVNVQISNVMHMEMRKPVDLQWQLREDPLSYGGHGIIGSHHLSLNTMYCVDDGLQYHEHTEDRGYLVTKILYQRCSDYCIACNFMVLLSA